VFKDGRLIGYASMFGHQSDIGGKVVGSMPINAHSIFEEGVRIPPVKLWKKGIFNEDLLALVLHQTRKPDWCLADLNALIASCRVAARRVIEMAERFGDDVYFSATQELLARNHRAMKTRSALKIISATMAWARGPIAYAARCTAKAKRWCSILMAPTRNRARRSIFTSTKTCSRCSLAFT